MNNSKQIYEKSKVSIDDSIQLYNFLKSNAKYLDASMLLRSQFVLLVSAFDTYVHLLVIEEVLNQFFNRTSSSEFKILFDVPIRLMFDIKNKDEAVQREMLQTFLKKKLRNDSFQSPKSIEYAFSIVGISKVWNKLSGKMNLPAEEIKDRLALIVNRRNKIAHESDWNSVTGTYEAIALSDVTDCKEFIDNLVDAMEDIVNDEQAV